MHTLIDGYPTAALNSRRARQLADQLDEFEALRARMLAIRNGPSDGRVAAARDFLAGNPPERIRLDSAAVEIYRFVRDVIGDWTESLQFIDRLPAQIREQPWMREQRALASSGFSAMALMLRPRQPVKTFSLSRQPSKLS